MDEPTSSLAFPEVEQLFAIVRRLKSTGVAIIYISHRLDEIFSISDRVTVIRDGAYIDTKPTAETDHQDLVQDDGRKETCPPSTRAATAPARKRCWRSTGSQRTASSRT